MNLLIPNKCYETVQLLLQQKGPQLTALREDKLLYIIYLIYNDSLTNDKALNFDYEGMALSSKILSETLQDSYKLHVSFLTDGQIIFQTRSHLVGSHCRNYIINPNLIDYPIWHTITHFTFKKRIKKFYSRQRTYAKRKYPYLVKWFSGLMIDYDSAEYFIRNEYIKLKGAVPPDTLHTNLSNIQDPKRQYDHANRIIKHFEKREFNFSVDGTGRRLHSLLTRCNKGLRNYITYKDSQLVSIDLKNSQPFLLLLLMNTEFLKSDMFYELSYRMNISQKYLCSIILPLSSKIQCRKEFQRFKCHVSEGSLYELFINEMQLHGEFDQVKKDAKMGVMIALYSNKGTHSSGAKKVFQKKFPLIYKFINAIKDVRYKNVAILLQRIESYLILDVVCKRIARERPSMPIYTIHDSIVTTVGNEEFVKAVMQDELLREVGVQPNVSIEYWANKNAIECPQQDG